MEGTVVGVDEAGRGPVLGPLVVAAARIPSPDALDGIGVDDSKRLSPARRRDLDRRIRDVAQVAVRAIEAEAIDRARRTRSLNAIEAEAFSDVLADLPAERAVVDAADVDPDRFRRRILDRIDVPELVSEHGADANHPVVGAASIVAKVERDRRMASIRDEIGDAGSGYPSDPTTRSFLRSWVEEHGDLPPHTRRSWSSAEELLASQSSLADF